MAGGRPTKLTKEIIEQAKNYCLLGATDVELSEFFDVNTSTIYHWRNLSEEFSNATKVGKEEANERVGRSLFTKACGYDKDGKHYPADNTSIIFWLKNRDPDNWKDVRERVETHKFDDADGVNQIELARRIAHILSEGLEQAQTQH
jgi:hypothetical protein